VHHAIQPGLRAPHFSSFLQRQPGAEKALLQGILGAIAGQNTTAVHQEHAPITRDERLERRLMAAAGELDQPGIALRRE
jgi:hypothetical protein